MRKSIEKKIRDVALARVSVRITGRSRSTAGFDCIFPTGKGDHEYDHDCINVPTRAEALALLKVKAMCCSKLKFEIRAATAKDVSVPWCVACKKSHARPTSAEHHAALQCRAKWREEA